MYLFQNDSWWKTKDGDRDALSLFRRHYSFRNYADKRRDDPAYRNRNLFVGPGGKIVLISPSGDALFVWRKFIDDSGQQGVNCAIFRNESSKRASDLILEAESWASDRWPGERMYTYVDAKKVKGTCPGYCFIRAGWRKCGQTKSGKLIFEKQGVAK